MQGALAIVGLVALLLGWVGVQQLWLRAFPHLARGEPDALAGRNGCHDCRCTEACERNRE